LGSERFQLRLHVGETLASARETWLEFLPVDQAVGVNVDHALQRALRGGELLTQ
jgi:hypothetical protein